MRYGLISHVTPSGITFREIRADIPRYAYREIYYWASEASPTLGCSIEISRDIYIYVCRYVVCLSYAKLTA